MDPVTKADRIFALKVFSAFVGVVLAVGVAHDVVLHLTGIDIADIAGGLLVLVLLLFFFTSVVGFVAVAALWGGIIRSIERAIAADVAEELNKRS